VDLPSKRKNHDTVRANADISARASVKSPARPVAAGLRILARDLRRIASMASPAFRLSAGLAAAALLASDGRSSATSQSNVEPFAFLAPEVVVSTSDRRRLDRDETIVRTLRGDDGQVAVFAATRLKAPPEALVTWTRAIEELKRSKFVLAARRFSDPPALSDLDSLRLDPGDVERIRQCKPGDCAVKLSAPEIESLSRVASGAGADRDDPVQAAFKRVVLARVNAYRAAGLAGLPPTVDRSKPARLDEAFAAILARSPYLMRVPNVARWLEAYPGTADRSIESFFYWSKESYGSGKPVISVTHVGIARPEPDRGAPAVLVSGKQILATHYQGGSLGLTMVLRDGRTNVTYLVYLNRSRVDVVTGFFGGLVRGLLEGRLEREAPQIIRGLRARLESGKPPGGTFEIPGPGFAVIPVGPGSAKPVPGRTSIRRVRWE
jgi:hypothetical protein